jgi:hypothetical protein
MSNWLSPHNTLLATTLTLRGCLFTFLKENLHQLLEGVTLWQTIVYAWWSCCSFCLWCKAVFELSLPRLMDRTKQTSSVAFMILLSNTCQLVLIGPSEGHNLLERYQHARWALAFDSSSHNNNGTYLEFFSTPGILGITGLSYAFRQTAFLAMFINIL